MSAKPSCYQSGGVLRCARPALAARRARLRSSSIRHLFRSFLHRPTDFPTVKPISRAFPSERNFTSSGSSPDGIRAHAQESGQFFDREPFRLHVYSFLIEHRRQPTLLHPLRELGRCMQVYTGVCRCMQVYAYMHFRMHFGCAVRTRLHVIGDHERRGEKRGRKLGSLGQFRTVWDCLGQ
jgi:hypothetical protein